MSRSDRNGATTAEFLAPLGIQHGEVEYTRADGGPWAACMVGIAVVRHSLDAYVISNDIPANEGGVGSKAGRIRGFI